MPTEPTSAQKVPDYASLFEGLVFAAIVIDPDGNIADLNHAAEMQLGKSKKRLIGVSAKENIELFDSRIVDRLVGNDSPLVARNVKLRANGEERQINLSISPLTSYPGWQVLTLSDTGRNDLDDQSDQGAASTGPPSILAHEIRNPLAAIRGAAQLVSRKLKPSDRSLGKVITDEVDRIARLIDRVQQLGGPSNEELRPTNLHEAIRSALATIRAGGLDGIELSEEFDPSLPPVLADRDLLEQTLLNLIGNAVDVLRDGDQPAPKITVGTRFESKFMLGSGHDGQPVKLPIKICVTDNGPGVDDALKDHIFEPFVTSKKSGQGLGLALVRKLVRDMKGRITYERNGREGLTHFCIHLALADGSEGS